MGYITEEREVTSTQKVITGAKCDRCQHDMQIGSAGGALNSLTMVLCGGYAEYFDDHNVSVTICKECADALLESFPFLVKAMEDQATW